MKLFKKIIIATGALFGLAVSLSLFQRKTVLLSGRIDFIDKTKHEVSKELKLEKEHRIRKISGNNEGFIIYKNKQEFLKSTERNDISFFGKMLSIGAYTVLPVSRGKNQIANIVIELVE